ncbi:hypothetical protein NX801_30055 [Streptomyces sp. LP05-1]|uniref:Uncharacterized protein n=1 Tax=Streptomyces pyxinae TaxID=2970734 RepID=A0ABT2CQT3_9ACTN|nr:hypothetical protein [Streptomyces sp. LP05-1]MCS0639806.1 hypothetical protein [Streptomyces sp. LP05-1]
MPASLAALLATALAVWASAGLGEGPGDSRPTVLALTAGVTVLSAGLGGQDPALDRTAAIRWIPRRAAHVLLGGAVTGAVLLAVRASDADRATTALVVRDSAGLMGLAALGPLQAVPVLLPPGAVALRHVVAAVAQADRSVDELPDDVGVARLPLGLGARPVSRTPPSSTCSCTPDDSRIGLSLHLEFSPSSE